MPDWYRDHNISPEAAGDAAYLEWAQDNGLRVDAAGNVADPAESRPADAGWPDDGRWGGGDIGPVPPEPGDDREEF